MDEVRRFSAATRKVLEKEGYIIYELNGRTIGSFDKAGRPFYSTWYKDYPDLENLPSRRGEVAINPEKLVIAKSNNRTLKEHEKMVGEFGLKLVRKIPGIKAIIGEAPDYVELVFLHFDKTGKRLFGEKYDYGFARTKTLAGGGNAVVGNFSTELGLEVFRCRDPEDRRAGIWLAPLVVSV